MARLNKKSTKDDLIQLLKENEDWKVTHRNADFNGTSESHSEGYEQAILDAAKALGLDIKPEEYKK